MALPRSGMEKVWLIAGLGNPGDAYQRTRHNAGFMVAEALAGRWEVCWSEERRFRACLALARRPDKRVLLCQPLTFMNLSGQAVVPVMRFYQVPPEQVLVLVDDADLPLGEIRLRPRGSSGGHHGLESIEQHLGSREFARLRIGIGRGEQERREITDYVLSPFRRAEMGLLKKVLERTCDQAECWLDEGLQPAMNRFNGVIEQTQN